MLFHPSIHKKTQPLRKGATAPETLLCSLYFLTANCRSRATRCSTLPSVLCFFYLVEVCLILRFGLIDMLSHSVQPTKWCWTMISCFPCWWYTGSRAPMMFTYKMWGFLLLWPRWVQCVMEREADLTVTRKKFPHISASAPAECMQCPPVPVTGCCFWMYCQPQRF